MLLEIEPEVSDIGNFMIAGNLDSFFLEQRVNERRHGRPLREDDEAAEQNHDDDDRRQPELLALTHEQPQILSEFDHQNGFSRFCFGGFLLGIR